MSPQSLQGLPPIPVGNSLDLSSLLTSIGMALVWTIVASICFAIAYSIGIRLLGTFFPTLDYVQEIKKGNLAVATFSAAFLICLAAVVVAVLLK